MLYKMWPIADQLLVLLLCLESVSSDCNIFSSRAVCTAVTDAEEYGNEKWKTVIINNTNSEALVTLKRNSFTNTPAAEYITIDGYLNGLETGAFDGIKNIFTLTMVNNRLLEIPPNVFAKVTVNTVDIDNCGVQTLKPGCFSNAINFRRLNIMNNPLRVLRAGIFNNLDLEDVYLQYDEISVIEDESLTNMQKLEVLSLRGNYLRVFESKRVLGASPTLSWLSLSDNQIAKVTKAMLEELPKLSVISLDHNKIQSIEEDSFRNIKNIEGIYLNNNSLEVILPSVFPSEGLRSIDWLYVDHNRLTYLATGVLNRLPSLEQLCFGGNPLQCGCYTELVKWKDSKNVGCYADKTNYFSGRRPACIVLHDWKQCVYGTDQSSDAQKLIQYYLNELPQYVDDTKTSA